MMKCVVSAVVACLVSGAAVMSYGQAACEDAFDKVLCVTALDDAADDQFVAGDGELSAFWAGIDADYFQLVPSNPQYVFPEADGFTDDNDASVYVKAAASSSALYLYMEVQDNVWVDWSNPTRYGDDSMDLYFDEQDAESAWANPEGPYNSHLTKTMKQLQVFMGATTVPQELRVTWYDAENYTWNSMEGAKQAYTFAEAKEKWGIEVDVIEVDATHKQQEWKLPWWGYASGGVTGGTNLLDTKLAFAGGYNDVDADGEAPDKLRWPGPKDPWVSSAADNQYGDLLFPDITVPVVETPRAAPVAKAAVQGVSTHLYTLTGQRVSSSRLPGRAATGVLVQRQVLKDGSAIANRMQIAR